MNWSTEYYRSRLSQEGKEAYDIIWLGWERADKQVVIPEGLISAEDIPRAFIAIGKDHPELFWVNPHEYRRAMRSAGSGSHTIELSLFHEPEMIRKLSPIIGDWREEVLSKLGGGMSQDEALGLLCNLIAHEVSFGENGLSKSHTIFGATDHGGREMVCEGIAKTLKYVCDMLGIPCICVTGLLEVAEGQLQAHMWNIVELSGGRRRHVDLSCFIAQSAIASSCGTTGRFLLKRDDEMDGYEWARDETPQCL